MGFPSGLRYHLDVLWHKYLCSTEKKLMEQQLGYQAFPVFQLVILISETGMVAD